jgi:hypothetical protein
MDEEKMKRKGGFQEKFDWNPGWLADVSQRHRWMARAHPPNSEQTEATARVFKPFGNFNRSQVKAFRSPGPQLFFSARLSYERRGASTSSLDRLLSCFQNPAYFLHWNPTYRHLRHS